MHDPIAAGRRSALRAVVFQAVVALLVALAFLVKGPAWALAAVVGGGALALGNALAALLSLGGIVRAPVAFARLLLGTLAKWCVVVALLAIALQAWRLPPLPLVAGLAIGLVAYLAGLNVMGTNVSGSNVFAGRQGARRPERKD